MELNKEERKIVKKLGINEGRLLAGEFEEYDALMDYFISKCNANPLKFSKRRRILSALIDKLSWVNIWKYKCSFFCKF